MTDAARLQWAQAMVVTGLVLYVPANVLPVMTMSIAAIEQRRLAGKSPKKKRETSVVASATM